ncbi:hypothetical protein NPIL_507901 [Nephila pilipes]|uniref:Uncharacterized protein n=1 Tax=Nephila pilipes TaxID=299642 RepID=A0A8X6N4J8_NEPPI|nr:hypothetical protein NPIL_507901 [Nephila pilipes]
MTQPVSIPEIQRLVSALATSDQCLHADTKIEEYLNSIPQITFTNQEEKNTYSTSLYSIQEEIRGKYNSFKLEEIKTETDKYKSLINSWGLPDANRPQAFHVQARRKNNTPIKTPTAKKQKTTPEAAECQNRFQTLTIEEPIEEIEIDDVIDEILPQRETRNKNRKQHRTPKQQHHANVVRRCDKKHSTSNTSPISNTWKYW